LPADNGAALPRRFLFFVKPEMGSEQISGNADKKRRIRGMRTKRYRYFRKFALTPFSAI